MKIANKLLFVYSLALSFFVVLSGLLNAKNIIGSLILAPIPLFFVVSLIKRKADGAMPKNGKGYAIIGVIFLALLGMGVYNISVAKENIGTSPVSSPVVVSKVGSEMVQVEVAVKGEPVAIKTEPNEESATINKVESTTTYESVGRDGKWYKVLLDDGSFGWINEQYVYEILTE